MLLQVEKVAKERTAAGRKSHPRVNHSKRRQSIWRRLLEAAAHELLGLIVAFVGTVIAAIGICVTINHYAREHQERVREHSEQVEEAGRQRTAQEEQERQRTLDERRYKAEQDAPQLFLRKMEVRAGVGRYTRFNYMFGNIGNSTAFNVIMNAETLVVRRPIGASNEEFDAAAKQRIGAVKLSSWSYPDVLSKMGHTGYWDDDEKITRREFNAMLKDELRVYAFGYLSYPAAGFGMRKLPFCVYTVDSEGGIGKGSISISNCPFEISHPS